MFVFMVSSLTFFLNLTANLQSFVFTAMFIFTVWKMVIVFSFETCPRRWGISIPALNKPHCPSNNILHFWQVYNYVLVLHVPNKKNVFWISCQDFYSSLPISAYKNTLIEFCFLFFSCFILQWTLDIRTPLGQAFWCPYMRGSLSATSDNKEQLWQGHALGCPYKRVFLYRRSLHQRLTVVNIRITIS
jgi:hypothetical protein